MALLQVGPQPFDLALHLLDLLPLLLEDGAQLPVLLRQLGVCGAAREGNEDENRYASHWPMITACTRRLRAQQVSFSSWQSGSSLP